MRFRLTVAASSLSSGGRGRRFSRCEAAYWFWRRWIDSAVRRSHGPISSRRFTPRRFFPDIPDHSLPEAWPISYEEMVPYYERAESLYRVRGTQDPLALTMASLLEPPPSSDRELAVFDALKGAGLSPYLLHVAVEHAPGCLGCPGMLCPRACRNDAARICLYPALDRYGAKILPSCRAIRFEARGRVVERVICEWNQRRIALRARVFILAANAFLTFCFNAPRTSASSMVWPTARVWWVSEPDVARNQPSLHWT